VGLIRETNLDRFHRVPPFVLSVVCLHHSALVRGRFQWTPFLGFEARERSCLKVILQSVRRAFHPACDIQFVVTGAHYSTQPIFGLGIPVSALQIEKN
jgi:hypothetical protein